MSVCLGSFQQPFEYGLRGSNLSKMDDPFSGNPAQAGNSHGNANTTTVFSKKLDTNTQFELRTGRNGEGDGTATTWNTGRDANASESIHQKVECWNKLENHPNGISECQGTGTTPEHAFNDRRVITVGTNGSGNIGGMEHVCGTNDSVTPQYSVKNDTEGVRKFSEKPLVIEIPWSTEGINIPLSMLGDIPDDWKSPEPDDSDFAGFDFIGPV